MLGQLITIAKLVGGIALCIYLFLGITLTLINLALNQHSWSLRFQWLLQHPLQFLLGVITEPVAFFSAPSKKQSCSDEEECR